MKAAAFGEILWDEFGRSRTLGGAPLNAAGHIRRLGGEVLVISALGCDELGDEAMEAVHELGIDDSFILRTPEYGTGRAIVTLSGGIPSYSFTYPSAWDMISFPEDTMEKLLSDSFDVLIYGTLAQRSEVSHRTLERILGSIDAKERFLDVNLRLSFHTPEIIRSSLSHATILKMNDEERPAVLSAAGCRSERELFDKHPDLSIAIVTCGKEGTWCFTAEGGSFHAEPAEVPVVDTVGAGDSLSAAFLFFHASGLDAGGALAKASMLADYVVQHRGAIPEYSEALRKKLFM